MAVMKSQVFLVQGQYATSAGASLGGAIEQLVVVAADSDAMAGVVAARAPDFQPVGWATLENYEATAAKLRAALKGEQTGWRVLVAPGMVE